MCAMCPHLLNSLWRIYPTIVQVCKSDLSHAFFILWAAVAPGFFTYPTKLVVFEPVRAQYKDDGHKLASALCCIARVLMLALAESDDFTVRGSLISEPPMSLSPCPGSLLTLRPGDIINVYIAYLKLHLWICCPGYLI
jgi:hypothetical protein